MKKHKIHFVLTLFVMSILSLSSCTDGYYHPDIPNYNPVDSTKAVADTTKTASIRESKIVHQQVCILNKQYFNLQFFSIKS